MTKISNYIFDIDGTILDTFDMYMPALFDVLKKHNYVFTLGEVYQIQHQLFGIAADDALKQISCLHDDRDDIKREWIDLAYKRLDRVKVYPQIPQVLNELAGRDNVHLGIVTSKVADEYHQYFLNHCPFATLFTTAVTASDTEAHKPAPDPILLAMEKLHADPSNTVYIGDMETDLQAAHAAGTNFAGALYGSVNPEAIQQADYKLTKPEELLII